MDTNKYLKRNTCKDPAMRTVKPFNKIRICPKNVAINVVLPTVDQDVFIPRFSYFTSLWGTRLKCLLKHTAVFNTPSTFASRLCCGVSQSLVWIPFIQHRRQPGLRVTLTPFFSFFQNHPQWISLSFTFISFFNQASDHRPRRMWDNN